MSDAPTATASASEQRSTGIPPWLSQLGQNPLVPLMIAGAAAIALIVALLLWATKPEYRVLFSNLTEADGGRIISELEQRGVPYRFSEGGQALLVPGDQVHALRLRLAEQGLPEGGNIGFEIMDNQAFGVSQFTEQVNFQRALEGQLASSIEALGPVAGARVHLAMARPSVFVREHQPAKASVVVTLQPGRGLGDGQVSAIVHLVSSSVPDLVAEAVTVVDQQGNLLSRRNTDGSGLDGTRLDYIRQVEKAYQQRILDILTPVLGSDNVRAQVTAEIDFSSREETSERYAPNQGENPAAVRSAQTRTAFTGGEAVARGVPGALTNVPPGAAASPVELPAGDDADEPAAGDEEVVPGNLQRDDLINYEVDRHITHVQHGRGTVQRLSAAVVVNHSTRLNDEGEPVQEALPAETLERLESLVRQAMGFSEARGDELALVNSPFTPEAAEPQLEQAWWQSRDIQHLGLTLARYLVVLIVALLLYRALVRPLVQRAAEDRRRTEESRQAVEPSFTAVVGDEDDKAGHAEVHDEHDRGEDGSSRRRRRSTGYEQNLKDFKTMAEEDPAMVAMIVRNWIAKYE